MASEKCKVQSQETAVRRINSEGRSATLLLTIRANHETREKHETKTKKPHDDAFVDFRVVAQVHT